MAVPPSFENWKSPSVLPSANVVLFGFPPVNVLPEPTISASRIPLFKIDSDALAGFCPALSLFSFVLSALENTLTPTAVAPSNWKLNTPSVLLSANVVLFGF